MFTSITDLVNFVSGIVPTQRARIADKTPLINGTQTLISLTTPNDGQIRYCRLVSYLRVTGTETGGQVLINWTYDGVGQNATVQSAGQVAGQYQVTKEFFADPGTAIILNQSTALTSGGAQLTALLEIQG